MGERGRGREGEEGGRGGRERREGEEGGRERVACDGIFMNDGALIRVHEPIASSCWS